MAQRTGSLRGLWIGLAVALCAVGLVTGVVVWSLDPAQIRPRLVEAVERATGRTLTISGEIRLKWSLVPTITLEDVTLSNPPGSTREEMVKAARLDLSFALTPLLRHRFEIEQISLIRPDIVLEIDRAGNPNWHFTRETVPKAETTASRGPAGGAFEVSVRNIKVTDGHAGWVDVRTGQRFDAEIPRLTVTRPVAGLLQANGAVTYLGRTVELSARTSPPRNAGGIDDAAEWPVVAKLTSDGASLSVEGHISRPFAARSYRLSVDADVPDPGAFGAWFPRLKLASTLGVSAQAEIGAADGAKPVLSALTFKAGSVDLGPWVRGTRLADVVLTARGQSPLKLSAHLAAPDFDAGVSGDIGDLAWLDGGARGPVAIDLEWISASARASVRGTVREPARFAGYTLDIAGDVPDPSQLSDRLPPALKSVAFRIGLTDTPGPVSFQFSSNAGDLTGEFSVSKTPGFAVSGHVSSRRLDLDVLRAHPAAPDRGTRPAAPDQGGKPAATAEPPPRDKSGPLFSDRKLNFDQIRKTAAEVTFALDQVRMSGTDVGAITGTVTVKDGVLSLKSFTIASPGASPGQSQTAALVVDAAAEPNRIHLTVDAPALPLPPMLDVLGLPPVASGSAGLQADLTATGDSPRALAASLDGWAGLAVENGKLDVGLVNRWLDKIRELHFEGANVTDLRCFAMRADARSGTVTIQPSALNTPVLIVDGSGEVDLGNETMALNLRPRTKIGKTGIVLPLRVSGRLRAPSTKVDISPAKFGGGALAGLLLGGKELMGAAGGGDPCPDALARAREPDGAK